MTVKDELDKDRAEADLNSAVDDIPDSELTPNVRKALFPMRAEVERLRAELSAARGQLKELESLANRDPLLDLFNRRAFMRELERALAMADRYGATSCLVFIDVNDLKKINDERGHRAGDAALMHVANVLSQHVRQTDIVGRLGGDEFGLILTHTEKPFAESKAAQLAAMIGEMPVEIEGGAFSVGISYGAAKIEKGVRVEDIVERADEIMYERKRGKAV